MNMKRLIKLLVLILFMSNVTAQEFAPLESKWYFPMYYSFSSSIGVLTYETIGDTIINNKFCKILFKDESTTLGNSGNYYFHQASDTIYHYDESNDEFDLVIVFNAEVGDTFLIEKPMGFAYPDSMLCIIDSISYLNNSSTDSLRIQNVRLVAPYFNGNDTLDAVYHRTIIEKVGFGYGLLPLEIEWLADWRVEGDIRCYEDSEIGILNFSDVDCLFTPTVNIQEDKLRIYPNPASQFITIGSIHKKITKIEILNSMGKVVYEELNPKAKIDISTLNSGIYLIKIRMKGEDLISKLVVTN